MKTEVDAKRAAQLYGERRGLQRSAATIRESEHLCISLAIDPDQAEVTPYAEIKVRHLTPELMALLGREVDMQAAAIDQQLAELGFAPPKDGP